VKSWKILLMCLCLPLFGCANSERVENRDYGVRERRRVLDGPAETAKFDRSNHQNPLPVCTFVGHDFPRFRSLVENRNSVFGRLLTQRVFILIEDHGFGNWETRRDLLKASAFIADGVSVHALRGRFRTK
jgi:hypothetical protein